MSYKRRCVPVSGLQDFFQSYQRNITVSSLFKSQSRNWTNVPNTTDLFQQVNHSSIFVFMRVKCVEKIQEYYHLAESNCLFFLKKKRACCHRLVLVQLSLFHCFFSRLTFKRYLIYFPIIYRTLNNIVN